MPSALDWSSWIAASCFFFCRKSSAASMLELLTARRASAAEFCGQRKVCGIVKLVYLLLKAS